MDMFHVSDLPAHVEDDVQAGVFRLHTPACEAQMAAQEAVYEAWDMLYGVTCCKFCFQTGLELNVFAASPPRPCWACIGQGRCPQCAGPFDGSREEQCAHCGWQAGVCKPDVPVCACWYDEATDELPF